MKRPRRPSSISLSLLAVFAFAGCNDQAPTPTSLATAPSLQRTTFGNGEFVIIATQLPADLGAQLTAAGGTLVRAFPEIGVAIATANETGFAERAAAINGIQTVTEDLMTQFVDPDLTVGEMAADASEPVESSHTPTNPNDDGFSSFQWSLDAVDAADAWAAGYTGRGVRVAILDGAIYDTHADLNGHVDVARSVSFVPNFAFNQDVGTLWHGTHVAGIVGALDNNLGTIGVAPNSTLIGVKVLHNGTGAWNWIISGIMYAATPIAEGGGGAHVINMSLGAYVPDAKDPAIKAGLRELTRALDLATRHAWKRGVTVVVSAGNERSNLDINNEAVAILGQRQHVIAVAATGPVGWAYGATNFSKLSSYSNSGKAVVDLAAPGGDYIYPGNELCTVIGPLRTLTRPCWNFDEVVSTVRGPANVSGAFYNWISGTSMAAPVTAGIAALIIEKAGGSLSPAQVKAELMRGATDLGTPGNDAVYGYGWVNAYNSVR